MYRTNGKWRDDKPTKAQLDYIKRIYEESEMPLPEFTGTTKGEASEWIQKHRYWAYHTPIDYKEYRGEK